jgi:AraC-like DNA-binding protein
MRCIAVDRLSETRINFPMRAPARVACCYDRARLNGRSGQVMDAGSGFAWRSIFHGRDTGETRAYLREGFGPDVMFDAARRRERRIEIRSEGVDLADISIHQTRLSAGFNIAGSAPDPRYVAFFPLCGRIEANAAGTSISCDPQRAFLLLATVRTEAPVAALVLRFSQQAVLRHLGALLGEPVDNPPQFALAMDLASGPGQGFARYLLMGARDFKHGGRWSEATATEFEDLMMAKLLMSHPHDYSAALRRAERPIAPRDMKRAIDYIEAKLGLPITIADVAEASGIAGRTLFKHFMDYHGISPMRYLRNARFAKAREALRRGRPDDSVTEIAMRCGFSHMGRFSVEYRRRFGEAPSETLRRRG